MKYDDHAGIWALILGAICCALDAVCGFFVVDDPIPTFLLIIHGIVAYFAVIAGLLSLSRFAYRLVQHLKNKTFRHTYKFKN